MYRDSSVGIATGWTAGVRFPAEAKRFSVLHSVHTGSGTHFASYSPVFNVEVKNGGTIIFTYPYAFIA
jgi:hypothetical protein